MKILNRETLLEDIKGGADLSNMDLRGADLSNMDLRGADLNGALLRGADLSNTNLSGANLSGAFLRGATLKNIDLSDADLVGTDLRDTNLVDANLSGAFLRGATLSGARGIKSFQCGECNRVSFAVKCESEVMFKIGCFWGNTETAILEVQEKYGENSAYEKLIKLYTEMLIDERVD